MVASRWRGSEETSLDDVMDRLATAGQTDKVSLNDILATFSARSTGVVITMLGLIAALPAIGAVPGISMVVSIMILGTIVNAVIGGGTLWLPDLIGNLGVSRRNFQAGIKRGRRMTRWIDHLLKRRLTVLTEGRLQNALLLGASGVLAIVMFPLEFVPWGVTAPAFGIVAFGLAMIAHDGLFALIGYAMGLATLGTLFAIF
ncbi:exopolysaccharide biosynthesis protein [Acuticoccus sp. M5D2P5]|uniref:exopolysaccharide biosynthesis protein n=1 Tax=Acuticoccus kalidii TaxID=2910977 RepID=UPI001F326DFF|nr:exopolysaccharide biosynthesis protein [Acuticoccus kalidii]MCF3935980.1 exopolysaccharide biosynthesis protein [Acuticoccus kalidii]